MDGETDDSMIFDDVVPGVKPEPPAAVPAFDLESTVRGLAGRGEAHLARADKELAAQDADRGPTINKMQNHMDKSEALLKDLQTKKFEGTKPEWSVPEFKAPDPQYNPAEALGSAASVMALMASAFTRSPMKNALNGATAVMQAEQAKDKVAYERAFNEFLQSKDTAVKHINFETQMYQLEQQEFQQDFNRGLQMAQQHRAAVGDEKALFLLRHDPEKYLELAKSYLTAGPALIKSYDDMEDYQIKQQDAEIENQAVVQARNQAVAAGKPFTAMDDANVRDDVRNLLKSRRVQRNGVGGRADQMIEIANAEEAAIEDAKGSLTGPELETRLSEIKREADEKRRRLYAPKEIGGASGINKELIAIDDAAPILEAMESLVDYSPEVVGVRGRANKVLGSIAGQLGANISDPAARAAQVAQLAASLEGPLTKIYTGSGQYSAAKKQLLGILEPSQNIMTAPEQFHNSMAWLKADLADKKSRRQAALERNPNPIVPSAAGSGLPEGIPAGSKKIGTSQGNDVYQTPDGKRLVVTK